MKKMIRSLKSWYGTCEFINPDAIGTLMTDVFVKGAMLIQIMM